MELKEQPFAPTLASKLGDTALVYGRAMPAIRELHDAFRAAQPKVLELARSLNSKS